jgi:hypothetical protein
MQRKVLLLAAAIAGTAIVSGAIYLAADASIRGTPPFEKEATADVARREDGSDLAVAISRARGGASVQQAAAINPGWEMPKPVSANEPGRPQFLPTARIGLVEKEEEAPARTVKSTGVGDRRGAASLQRVQLSPGETASGRPSETLHPAAAATGAKDVHAEKTASQQTSAHETPKTAQSVRSAESTSDKANLGDAGISRPDQIAPAAASPARERAERRPWPKGNFTPEQELLRAQIGWDAFSSHIFQEATGQSR